MLKNNNMENNSKMPLTAKSIKFMLVGFLVMLAGYIMMIGFTKNDPQVFNYDIFDFRRLVAAPLIILAGIVIEIISIMGIFTGKKKD